MKLSEIKREQLEAEKKCRRELLYFAILCIAVFIVAPLGVVLSINYSDEIDLFFNFKMQVIFFIVIVIIGSLFGLIRWYRKF